MLKKILLALTAPLRYLIRYEIKRAVLLLRENHDIHAALERRALESTAEYVEKNMLSVDSVDSHRALLTKALREADLSGNKLICEFGVFSGASINHIASHTASTVFGFDSFKGLPTRWREGYDKGHFALFPPSEFQKNVKLVTGWFDQTLPIFLREHREDVCFIHMDCDLYSSTKTVLTLLKERIKPGCIIVFDEYFNYPGWEEGEDKAFREFINETGLKYEYLGYNRNHAQVAVKIKANS